MPLLDDLIGVTERTFFQTNGYLILSDLLDQATVDDLNGAVETVIDKGMMDQCGIKWMDKENRIPDIEKYFLHPDMYQSEFGDLLNDYLIDITKDLLETDVRYFKFGMFSGGSGHSYDGGWHRDFIGYSDDTNDLRTDWESFVQINLALYDNDDFLYVIPGSHTSNVSIGMDSHEDKAGQLQIQLNAGDAVLYSPFIAHRGKNMSGLPRRTLHGKFLKHDYPITGSEDHQKDILLTPGHLTQMPAKVQQYIQYYIDVHP